MGRAEWQDSRAADLLGMGRGRLPGWTYAYQGSLVGGAFWIIAFAVTLVGGHPALGALALVAVCVGVAVFAYPRYRPRGEPSTTGPARIDDGGRTRCW